jgi:DNA repair photolyase
MKAATAKELRDELKDRTESELREIVLRLSRFKKENKELLSYLLFESHHEEDYVANVKTHIDQQLLEINTSNGYYAKKAIRRILKETKKFIRYSGSKESEVSLLIHFCRSLQETHPKIMKVRIIRDIVQRQIVLIKVRISTLHEDLQYDFEQELNEVDY